MGYRSHRLDDPTKSRLAFVYPKPSTPRSRSAAPIEDPKRGLVYGAVNEFSERRDGKLLVEFCVYVGKLNFDPDADLAPVPLTRFVLWTNRGAERFRPWRIKLDAKGDHLVIDGNSRTRICDSWVCLPRDSLAWRSAQSLSGRELEWTLDEKFRNHWKRHHVSSSASPAPANRSERWNVLKSIAIMLSSGLVAFFAIVVLDFLFAKF